MACVYTFSIPTKITFYVLEAFIINAIYYLLAMLPLLEKENKCV